MRGLVAVLASVLLLFSVPAAQAQDTLWARTYGGSNWDFGYCAKQTSDGGYIVVGSTESFGAAQENMYLVKTDPDGDTLWTRTYGGTDYTWSVGEAVQQTADGGYIILGAAANDTTAAYIQGVFLVKTDIDGDTQWTRLYGGDDWDGGHSVLQTTDGGYIIVGSTHSFGAGGLDVYLLKTDANGDTLWTRTFGGSQYDEGYSVQQTTDGGYIIGGHTYSVSGYDNDFCLVKTDDHGDTLWTRIYGGSGFDFGKSVQQTDDRGYIFAGYTSSFGAGGNDYYLVKTAANGDPIWTRTYGGTYWEIAYSVQQTEDGGYIVAGQIEHFYGDDRDLYIVRTDASGDTLWTRTYGGELDDFGRSVQNTSDGDYIVCGGSKSFGAGACDLWLLKLAECAAADQGRTENVPGDFVLCQNYPNPFNATTAINYQLPADAHVTFEIYNLLGHRVATLVGTKQQAGYGSVVWDASEVSSGIYFYKLSAGDYTEAKRMMLVK
jgi:hypothetical protein